MKSELLQSQRSEENEYYTNIYKKKGDRILQLRKGGIWEDVTEQYNENKQNVNKMGDTV